MKKDFWVTNITNKNVSLRDLNLTIKPRSSINLLDYRRYGYKIEDLEKSSKEGSLFIKRSMIVLRNNPPEVLKNHIPIIQKSYIPSRARSTLSMKQEVYEELEISDEKLAEDNIETIEIDELKAKRI